MINDTRDCPYCGETIRAAALKCRWCAEPMPDPPKRRPHVAAAAPAARHPEGAGTILVMGILGFVLCFIFGIVAWVQGNEYVAKCRRLGLSPEGSAEAGRILGMICSILVIVGLGIVMLMAVGGGLR